MVACVPFRYANLFAGVVAMYTLAILALVSTAADSIAARR
jgi:hypothetical protein